MKHNYAKSKLTSLLRDLNNYTADEFRRQMARIISGATGQDIPDDCHTIKAERDALAAQLSLAKNIFDVLFSLPDAGTREEISSEIDTWLQLKAVFDETPQQCLRDVKADAGRKGFIAGVNALSNAKTFGAKFDRDSRADEHAATVRQGGAE